MAARWRGLITSQNDAAPKLHQVLVLVQLQVVKLIQDAMNQLVQIRLLALLAGQPLAQHDDLPTRRDKAILIVSISSETTSYGMPRMLTRLGTFILPSIRRMQSFHSIAQNVIFLASQLAARLS
ncbi:hypothetical protein AAY81_05875 [Denitrobacterium detoxificans]|nr:hypothetical protein AAY81_05875 [Denitrobacterium detoxificans]